MAAHFKQINLGYKTGYKEGISNTPHGCSSACKRGHAETQTNIWRNTYDRIGNKVSIWTMLISGPTSKWAEQKNLEGLDQLLQKQATFCKEITLVTNNDVQDMDQEYPLTIKRKITQWMLHKVLMQFAHPDQEECSFFHVIDCNCAGSSISVAMLPNVVALQGHNSVQHLLPFVKWILKLTLGQGQAQQVSIAFTPDTINRQATWQWDPANNCVLQANSTLIGCALNDFLLYNLMASTQLPTMVTTMAQSAKPPQTAQATSNWNTTMATHTVNNSNSLSSSTLSQGMWLTSPST